MSGSSNESGREPNLLVKVALLEQRLQDVQEQSRWLRETTDSLSRRQDRQNAVTGDRLRAIEWYQGQTATTLVDHHHSLSGLGSRLSTVEKGQRSHQELAVRLRYGAALVLVGLTLAGRLAPDTLGKALKVLALLP